MYGGTFLQPRTARDEGVHADSDKLLDAHHAFDDHMVLKGHVSRNIHGIGQNHVVSNLHVVGNGNIGQDQAVTSPAGDHLVCGRTVNGHALADAGAVADAHGGGFAVVLQVLRVRPDHTSREQFAVSAHGGVPQQGRMGSDPRAGADGHFRPNKGKGLDQDVGANLR